MTPSDKNAPDERKGFCVEVGKKMHYYNENEVWLTMQYLT